MRVKPSVVLAVATAGVLIAASVRPSDSATSSSAPDVPAETATPTTMRAPVQTVYVEITTVPTSTTVTPIPSDVAGCMQYVPLGAFLGDPGALDRWNFIGQDPTRLQELCESVVRDDPQTAQQFATMLLFLSGSVVATTDP